MGGWEEEGGCVGMRLRIDRQAGRQAGSDWVGSLRE